MRRDWFFPFKEAHSSAYLLQGAISLRMSWDLQQSAAVELVAVCDPLIERTRRFAQIHNIEYTFHDVEQMLDTLYFELLVNLTPMPLHAPINRKAIEAKRHVWSEKPFAQDLAEAQELLGLARQRDVGLWAAPAHPKGQAREALTCLEQVIAQATAQQRQEQVLEARIVQALAWQAMRQEERALAPLAGAVRLAEPEGYQRIFVDEGARLQTLLASLRSGESQQSSASYRAGLLAAFASSVRAEEKSRSDTVHSRRISQSPSPLLDPLGPREQEVLHLLAQGASNQESERAGGSGMQSLVDAQAWSWSDHLAHSLHAGRWLAAHSAGWWASRCKDR